MSKFAKLRAKQQERVQTQGVDAITPLSDPSFDFAHYNAALKEDLSRLSALASVDEKIVLKQELIKKYLGFVLAYIDNVEKYKNPVAVRVMIWLFDTQTIEPGLKIALHLIGQRIHEMPDGFKSDMQTFVCDYTYDWAAALLKKQQPASPYLEDLVTVMDDQRWQLSPPVQSKMYAMLAKHKDMEGDFKAVVALCDKAAACNPDGHGTKTLRTKALEKL